ncbi:hypothetical protein [Sphingobacterium humi]|uniref:DUF4252 domain-containing protein n=1 Tax=Sphingobacterium humi TaxID=1796905 RepID=A0A6N8L560_9SPHI|nr:hypothetical protein [Sphingobacterium humi]MVZ63308.1 hypothetical protein [Sphingobacterium humi]
MGKHLLLLISIIIPYFASAQAPKSSAQLTNSLTVAKHFIQDLADLDLALDIVLSEQVIVKNPDQELYDYLEASLQEIRLNLSTKKIEELQFKKYHELPQKEVRDIDPEGLNVEQMVFVYSKNRLLTALYVEGNKIRSFTLVSKGNEMAHFVTY